MLIPPLFFFRVFGRHEKEKNNHTIVQQIKVVFTEYWMMLNPSVDEKRAKRA